MNIRKTPLGMLSVLMDISPLSLSRLLVDAGYEAIRLTKCTWVDVDVRGGSKLLYLATTIAGEELQISIDVKNNRIVAHIYS